MTTVQLTEQGPACRVHQLKCWPPYFEEVASGRKLVDIRCDDRGFRVGDVLIQREWKNEDPSLETGGGYTGKVCVCAVTHVLAGGQFGLQDGYVALSLGPVDVLSGLPLESGEQWAVFYGGEDFDSCAGWIELSERAECEELLQFLCQDAGVGRRLVLYGPWEVVTRDE